MSKGAKGRRRRERVYHAPELAETTPVERWGRTTTEPVREERERAREVDDG